MKKHLPVLLLAILSACVFHGLIFLSIEEMRATNDTKLSMAAAQCATVFLSIISLFLAMRSYQISQDSVKIAEGALAESIREGKLRRKPLHYISVDVTSASGPMTLEFNVTAAAVDAPLFAYTKLRLKDDNGALKYAEITGLRQKFKSVTKEIPAKWTFQTESFCLPKEGVIEVDVYAINSAEELFWSTNEFKIENYAIIQQEVSPMRELLPEA